ncbi:MAG: thiol oxidoreductase [Gammaproteobacteria bacterium]|nr:thiol oxidoreductase [Gammaproteobacteria bacterium]
MSSRIALLLLSCLLPWEAVASNQAKLVAPTRDFSTAEQSEAFPGGTTTTRRAQDRALFSHPAANLDDGTRLEFQLGKALFQKTWVSAPASTGASDGLGPLYNARSCAQCHIRNGRGHPPEHEGDSATSILLRIDIPAQNHEQQQRLARGEVSNIAEPTYGRQLQGFAVGGLPAEHHLRVSYSPLNVTLADGSTVELRNPGYVPTDLGYGPLHPQTRLSPRIAPPMIGLGLVQAIDVQDLMAGADPNDADGDGISGRANYVWSVSRQAIAVGRFGHKAGQASLDEQVQDAFFHDIGLSVPAYPAGSGECTRAQTGCLDAANGNSPRHQGLEVGEETVRLTGLYTAGLAVPMRKRAGDPAVLAGKRLFYETGCVKCHAPKFVTSSDAAPVFANELIWPYSDFLLHDMGEGLADHRPEGQANGREWRTPPLWGLGQTVTVGNRESYLHDGRARSVLEAVLWHGGEAQSQRDAVIAMDPTDRTSLLTFLASL